MPSPPSVPDIFLPKTLISSSQVNEDMTYLNVKANRAIGFNTRQDLINSSETYLNGSVAIAAGYSYLYAPATNVIPDLPNWLPINPTPSHFGCVGNGSHDDTQFMNWAIQAQVPLNFERLTYRVTSVLSLTQSKDLHWYSQGAIILFDGTIRERVIDILSAGFSFSCVGSLTINANLKAFRCLVISQANSSLHPDCLIDGMIMRNPYRSSKTFQGGDGGYIEGQFNNITLLNCSAYNCVMAVSAGVAGAQGIFGWTITNISHLYANNVVIDNMYIDHVYSEDLLWHADQDGIRIFSSNTGVPNPSIMPLPTNFAVTNSYFKNCYGRALKIKTEAGTIDNCYFVRNLGWTDGTNPVLGNYEIDFQNGGGTVTNCTCNYTNYAPLAFISFHGDFDAGDIDVLGSGGTADNIKVFMYNTPLMDRLIRVGPQQALTFNAYISNIEVVVDDVTLPRLNYLCGGSLTVAQGPVAIFVTDVKLPVQQALVLISGTAGHTAYVQVFNAINTGTTVDAQVIADGNSQALLSNQNCIGFIDYSNYFAFKGHKFNIFTIAGIAEAFTLTATKPQGLFVQANPYEGIGGSITAKLAIVGTFGLGQNASSSVVSPDSLDTIAVTQYNHVTSGNVATVNGPSGALGGLVFTQFYSSGNCKQEYQELTSTRRWWRDQESNVWSAWYNTLQVDNKQVVSVRGAAVSAVTVNVTSGSLPTPTGSFTIANAATPTVTELLRYCVELQNELDTLKSRLSFASGGHGLIA